MEAAAANVRRSPDERARLEHERESRADQRLFMPSERSYQQQGVLWLLQRSMWASGACLADEMGLGKTPSARQEGVRATPGHRPKALTS
jgi:SNF2 family DNA or RNA helicase